ncbi:MAG: hypothetical protein U1E17_12700 [Geminicoccaceae bacterium]
MSGPRSRTFKVDLHREVPRQRSELAAAALTIIRAYLAAGSPPQPVPTFGRFEQWQAWCRFPLIWLGVADPCSTRAAARKDPVRARLGAPCSGSWRPVRRRRADGGGRHQALAGKAARWIPLAALP